MTGLPGTLLSLVAAEIHQAEMYDWPPVAADPKGGCLGRDRCGFVAPRVLRVVLEAVVGKLQKNVDVCTAASEEYEAAFEDSGDDDDRRKASDCWIQAYAYGQAAAYFRSLLPDGEGEKP